MMIGQMHPCRLGHLYMKTMHLVWQSKTKKYRVLTINGALIEAVQAWLLVHPDPRAEARCFCLNDPGKR